MPATAKNTNAVDSAAASGNADATHFGLFDASTGGNFLQGGSLGNDPAALRSGDKYRIPANALTLTEANPAGGTSHAAERAVRGRIAGGVWVSWHSGDPGTNGANAISTVARTQIAASGFTVART